MSVILRLMDEISRSSLLGWVALRVLVSYYSIKRLVSIVQLDM